MSKTIDRINNYIKEFEDFDDESISEGGGKIVIEIETGNAAFEDADYEVAGILKKLASKIETGGLQDTKIRDTNGNTVGFLRVE